MSHSDGAKCAVEDWIRNMIIAKVDEVPLQHLQQYFPNVLERLANSFNVFSALCGTIK
jgi:hypothetical protein